MTENPQKRTRLYKKICLDQDASAAGPSELYPGFITVPLDFPDDCSGNVVPVANAKTSVAGFVQIGIASLANASPVQSGPVVWHLVGGDRQLGRRLGAEPSNRRRAVSTACGSEALFAFSSNARRFQR